MVGDKLREVIQRDGPSVQPYGDPSGSFLVGGQITGETPRLFQIYSAGNFIEASLALVLPADRRDQVRQADPGPRR